MLSPKQTMVTGLLAERTSVARNPWDSTWRRRGRHGECHRTEVIDQGILDAGEDDTGEQVGENQAGTTPAGAAAARSSSAAICDKIPISAAAIGDWEGLAG